MFENDSPPAVIIHTSETKFWKDSYRRNREPVPEVNLVIQYPRYYLWFAAYYLLFFLFCLIAVHMQTSKNTHEVPWAGLFLGFLSGLPGIIMMAIFSRPMLRLDETGISVPFSHLPWDQLKGFDLHGSTDEKGQIQLKMVSFKLSMGRSWEYARLSSISPQQRGTLLHFLSAIGIKS